MKNNTNRCDRDSRNEDSQVEKMNKQKQVRERGRMKQK